MTQEFINRINQRIAAGERVKELFDLSSETDLFIVKRLSYFYKELPLPIELGRSLTENEQNNCFLDIYTQLRDQGRIL